jgi:hypothetical protein
MFDYTISVDSELGDLLAPVWPDPGLNDLSAVCTGSPYLYDHIARGRPDDTKSGFMGSLCYRLVGRLLLRSGKTHAL